MTSKIQSEKIVGKMYESQNQSKPRRDFKKPGSCYDKYRLLMSWGNDNW